MLKFIIMLLSFGVFFGTVNAKNHDHKTQTKEEKKLEKEKKKKEKKEMKEKNRKKAKKKLEKDNQQPIY